MAVKLTIDTANKLFILKAGVISLDAKVDLYSDVKEDWLADANLTKFKFPVLATAVFDVDLVNNITNSPYFVLLNGWKVRPHEADHTLTINGNLITSDGSDPLTNTIGAYNVRVKYVVPINSQTTTVTVGSGVTAQDKTDIIDGIATRQIDGTVTLEQIMKMMGTILGGKSVITDLGGGSANIKFYNLAGTAVVFEVVVAGSERGVPTLT